MDFASGEYLYNLYLNINLKSWKIH